jgi:hypothetical protein
MIEIPVGIVGIYVGYDQHDGAGVTCGDGALSLIVALYFRLVLPQALSVVFQPLVDFSVNLLWVVMFEYFNLC